MATYASIKYKVGTDRTGTIPTAAIADNAITTAKINADAVTDAKIADDVVGTEHLTAGEVDTTALGADAVTAAKIADDVVNSEHYAAGSIDNEHIADDAIDSEHYADGSIDNAHIADDQIDSEHYAAASIDNEHLADDAVGVAELSASGTASSSTFLRGDNSWTSPGGGFVGTTSGTISGSLNVTNYGTFVNHTGSFSSPAGATGGVVHASWLNNNALGVGYLKSVSGGTASSTDRSFSGSPADLDGYRLGMGRGQHRDTLFFACGASESLTLTFAITRGQSGSPQNSVSSFQFSVMFV